MGYNESFNEQPIFFPLTSSQLNVWLDCQNSPNIPEYNIGGYIVIDNTFEEKRFRNALEALSWRHDVLRLEIVNTDEHPKQRIINGYPSSLTILDFADKSSPIAEAQLWMQQDMQQPLDIYKAPLWRTAILKLSKSQYCWYYVFHRLICDEISLHIVASSLNEIYAHQNKNLDVIIGPSYLATLETERQYRQSDQYRYDARYWTQQYKTQPQSIVPLTAKTSEQNKTLEFELDSTRVTVLSKITNSLRATPPHFLITLLYLFLSRTYNLSDISLGIAFNNRRGLNQRNTLGLFSNTMPVRFAFDKNQTFTEVIQLVNQQLKQSLRHKRFPQGEINHSFRSSDLGQADIFDVELSYISGDYGDSMLGALANPFSFIANNSKQTPLRIHCWDDTRNGLFRFYFSYNQGSISDQEMQQIIERLDYLMTQVIENSELPLNRYILMSSNELKQLQKWSCGPEYINNKDTSLVNLFEKQVAKHPESVALVFAGESMCYQELNQRANRLAHRLLELGVEAETLVGLSIERSPEMVIGLLAILKSGGAYVPIDISYPKSRIQYMLDDSGISLLLTHASLIKTLHVNDKIRLLDINIELNQPDLSVENPQVTTDPRHLAHIIYTSGSTGKPKGVMIEQSSIICLISEPNYMSLNKQTRMLQLAPISFDAATLEIWGPLCNGGQLILMPPGPVGTETIAQIVKTYGVNSLLITTALFNQMVEYELFAFVGVKQLLFGGEACSPNHVIQIRQSLPDCQIVHCYGPTENTTISSYYPITCNESITQGVPIGSPINATQLFILDAHAQLLPPGLPGELYIGGEGLARGYLNNPELTAERFIEVELYGKKQSLYRSGDKVRWSKNGQLEFLGRLDNQIKIRGYRIELGEIEVALGQHQQVKEAQVIIHGTDSDKHLIAYLIAEPGNSATEEDLQLYLKQCLPDYMLPNRMVFMESWPLTPNGKIDRKHLPIPEWARQTKTPYIRPQGDTETRLAEIWSQILNIAQVGAADNFFELGGHSLMATQVINQIRDQFSIELGVNSLFEIPQLDLLAKAIEQVKSTAESKSRQPDWLNSEQHQQQLSYWLKQLKNASPLIELPTDFPRSSLRQYNGAFVPINLDKEICIKLKQISQSNDCTLHMILLATFNLLLSRQSGKNDILIGIPSVNRSLQESEDSIEFFLNTLVIRIQIPTSSTFVELLKQVRRITLEAYENQDIPFELLVEHTHPKQSVSYNPISQVLFNLVNDPNTKLGLLDLQVDSLNNLESTYAKFDISLVFWETDNKLQGKLIYDSNLFDAQRMSTMVKQLVYLLKQISVQANLPLNDYTLITPGDKTLVFKLEQPLAAKDYPLFTQQFLTQVNKHPESIAIRYKSVEWSYIKLYQNASKIAQLLLYRGLKKEDVVAISGQRGPDIIVSILGVLLSGGVCLTLDNQLPSIRRKHMLQKAQARYGIILDNDKSDWITDICQIIDLSITPPIIQLPKLKAEQPAYIFFTSGTTGTPKGITGTHAGLAHFLDWQSNTFHIGPDDNLAQLTSPSFDVYLRDIGLPLSCGATICIAEDNILFDGSALFNWLKTQQITLWHSVPSLLQTDLTSLLKRQDLPDLRYLFIAGEPLTGSLIKQWHSQVKSNVQIINLYGPTETTLAKCFYPIKHHQYDIQPLGQPLPETQVLILNQNQQCGFYELGEIVIRTPFRTQGYLNSETLNFLVNPYRNDPNDLIYYTGDFGYRQADGLIMFQGRRDLQVKIRGVRIELSGIETVLRNHPLIEQSMVTVQGEDINKQLIAYITPKQNTPPSAEILNQDLSRQLPSYMLPSAFISIPAFPLTPNGKIDRKQLPIPIPGSHTKVDFIPPQGQTEILLAQIWSQILNIAQIGTEDNFFELGGHSLMATQVMSRVSRLFNVNLGVRNLFETPKLGLLARIIELAQQTKESKPRLQVTERPTNLPLSYAQQRLWFLDQFGEGSNEYNLPEAFRLKGKLNVSALTQAFNALITRHETLRTRFIEHEGQACQVIEPQITFSLPLEDLSHLNPEQQQVAIESAIHQEWLEPFNLSNGPLIRARLIQLNSQEHLLLRTQHHIISDGWSSGVFNQEFAHYYAAYAQNFPPNLPPLPIQYADFSLWQRKWLDDNTLNSGIDYWKEQLAGIPNQLKLPTKPRPPVQTFAAKLHPSVIPMAHIKALKQLGLDHQATLYMTLLSIFGILMSRYSGQEDFTIGSPIANRQDTQLEKLIGFFVNTLVIRLKPNAELSFCELLKAVRTSCLDAYRYQDVPFERLVEVLAPERDLSLPSLFQVIFALQNTPMEAQKLVDLAIYPEEHQTTQIRFDLEVHVFEHQGQQELHWIYNQALFDSAQIVAMDSHFRQLLEQVIKQPEQSISTYNLLTKKEKKQIQTWGSGKTIPAADLTIVNLFEAQVQQHPEAVALIFEEQELTYTQVNRYANRLAHQLIELGVKAETLVGLCLERSFEMVIGLLAILKAGGAYVPIDADYPEARIRYMLNDTGIKLLLTQDSLIPKLPKLAALELINIAQELKQTNLNETNPQLSIKPKQLAYVIYTSGSTGQPKGVMVEQRNIIRLVSQPNYMSLDKQTRILQMAPISFDAATLEIWGPLCNGGQMILMPPGPVDTNCITRTIQHKQINTLWLTAGLFHQIVDNNLMGLAGVKQLLAGGDILSPKHITKTLNAHPNCQLINGYGPTENTTFSSYYPMTRNESHTQEVPIGFPINATQLYVLDAHAQLLPPGLPGELYIGGEGLARSYLNNPELTAEKFIEVELFGKKQRLYRSGDKVRWNPNGHLEFLGRLDNQIKLRGYRIELGEIEAVLCQHKQVREAQVISHGADSNKRLIAYLLFEPNNSITKEQLYQYLKKYLPNYMLPSTLIFMDSWPLTPNGKIDRNHLPKPESRYKGDNYETPRTANELKLVEIWSAVLKKEGIGIHDNFFHLGGDSIQSIQVVAKARQSGLALKARDLFNNPTIAELTLVAGQIHQPIAEQGMIQDQVPLTPIQSWYFTQELGVFNQFSQAILLEAPPVIAPEVLKQAFSAVIRHHDALRLCFNQKAGKWQQIHRDVSNHIPFHCVELTEPNLDKAVSLALPHWSDFNLNEGPLTHLILFTHPQGKRLLWVTHHLVVDGVSWRILLDDLNQAYQQAFNQQPIRLAPKTSSFKAWSEQLQRWYQGESFALEQNYWSQLKPLNSHLPIDMPEGTNRYGDIEKIRFSLDKTATTALLEESPAAYNTGINDLLLSALLLTLHNVTEQEQFLINLESHGRGTQFDRIDLSRTVGWLTALYSVRLSLPSKRTFGAVIQAVKEQLRAVPNEGIGYGLMRQQGAPLPQGEIVFNYLGQFNSSNQATELRLAQDSPFRGYGLSGERETLLDINAITVHGQLTFIFSYSRELFHRETIESLVNDYQHQLMSLIQHCQNHYGYTPSDFPLAQLTQTRLDELAQTYGHNIEAIYPLSPMQQGLLFHQVYDTQARSYYVKFYFHLSRELDPKCFHKAWSYLVQRHPILRTAFLQTEVPPLQIVCREANLSWEELDWQQRSSEQRTQQWQQLLAQQLVFDFKSPPLMRFHLINEGREGYRLLWNFHHILLDGWSWPILLKELFTVYNALNESQYPSLSPVIPYQKYIAWVNGQDIGKAKIYWQQRLSGIDSPTTLPLLQVAQSAATYKNETLGLTQAETSLLNHTARDLGITLNTLIQAAWAILLGRYSGEREVIFGVTVSGRDMPIRGIETMVGLFINTLPFRVKLTGSVFELLMQIHTQFQTDNQYNYVSLAEVQGWSELPNGMSLFETIVVFENYPFDESVKQPSHLPFKMGKMGSLDPTHYPLSLQVIPGANLSVKFTYEQGRISPHGVNQIMDHLGLLVIELCHEVQTPIDQLRLLTEAEKQCIYQWSTGETKRLEDKALPELFESQVAISPEAIALTFNHQQLSYLELNQQANRLAHRLIQLGVKTEILVGLCLERSFEMVIGLLAILKAGGAYIPIDADYPKDRIRYMLEDSGIRLLLTEQGLTETLPTNERIQVLDIRSELNHSGLNEHNPQTTLKPCHLAYVIYTSGSTGKPKGVMVEHGSLINFLLSMREIIPLSEGDRFLATTTISFDISALEIFLPIIFGATSCIVSRETRQNGLGLKQYIKEQGITLIQGTPATYHLLIDAGWTPNSSVRLLCGGESLSPELANKLSSKDVELFNLYGPTETTIWSTIAHIKPQHSVNIGQPIHNTHTYILDANGKLLPPGLPGELYIGGAGLTRGYLNHPELTAERFITLEFSDEQRRLYRTGDKVRWNKKGHLEFLGRLDHQIKLRGYRIELGEIEAVLREHEQVDEALVLVRGKNEDKTLLAYALCKPEHSKRAQSNQTHIHHWQQLYQNTYAQNNAQSQAEGQNKDHASGDFDLASWASSYSGEPIPNEEMAIWVEETVKRIRSLNGKRVLEIGCGTGLLLTRLAPECETYIGLDFSQMVLDHLSDYLTTRNDLNHVELHQGLAHELDFLNEGSFDLIILNSVVQYFPDMDYLLLVLTQAQRVVTPDGCIFMGDIRNLTLLEAYHASVLMHQAEDENLLDWVRTRLSQRVANEKELLLEPKFFNQLAKHWPGVARAELRLKAGDYDNELSRFRYDVSLFLGEKQQLNPIIHWYNWDSEGLWQKALRSGLSQYPQQCHAVRLIPDSRAAKAVQISAELNDKNYSFIKVGELLQLKVTPGQVPNQLFELANLLQVDLIWQGMGSDGHYQVLFNPQWDKTNASQEILPQPDYSFYANNPVQREDHIELAQVLKAELKQRLPDYMVPSSVVILDTWPLTANGKIDHKRLPEPGLTNRGLKAYIAPRNPQETAVADIWQEILMLSEAPGIYDDFFELGGHSLLSAKMVSRIATQLGHTIDLKTFFQIPTIDGISQSLAQKPSQLPIQENYKQEQSSIRWPLPEVLQYDLNSYVGSWNGERASEESLIVGLNLQGTQPPLFWIFQGEMEFSQLAHYLGEDQPVYGMRSGYLLMDYTEDNIQAFALRYVEEIEQLHPEGPLFIGGNCQAGIISLAIAQHLLRRQRILPMLFLLEWGGKPQFYPGKVTLLYGEQSEQINPYFQFKYPELSWERYFGEYSVDFIPCGHGQFWKEPYIQIFANKLKFQLSKTIVTTANIPTPITCNAEIVIINSSTEMFSGELRLLCVQIKNTSQIKWSTTHTSGIMLGNRWLDTENNIVNSVDGRVPLITDVKPGQVVQLYLPIQAPDTEAMYQLEIDMIEEGVSWFSDQGSQPASKTIQVKPLSIDSTAIKKPFKFPYPKLASKGPILIGGTGGSGTRVLSKVLQLAGVYMGSRLNQSEDSLEMIGWLGQLVNPEKIHHLSTKAEFQIASRLQHKLTDYLLKEKESSHNEFQWGWKLPPSIFYLPLLYRYLPNLKCIHLIRDGRDMAFSSNQNQLAYLGPLVLDEADQIRPTPERSILLWQKLNSQFADYAEDNLPKQYLRIRYEDLCQSPKKTLTHLFNFLGIKAEVKPFAKQISASQGIGRWKEQNSETINRLEYIASTGLKRFNYWDTDNKLPTSATLTKALSLISKSTKDALDNGKFLELSNQHQMLTPELGKMFLHFGEGYFQTGQYEKAIQSFSQGIAIAPDNAQLHFKLGQSFVAQSNWQSAIDAYHLAIDKAELPNGLYWSALATSQQAIGQQKEATISLVKAIQLEPNQIDWLNKLALIYTKRKKFNLAINIIQQMNRLTCSEKNFPWLANLLVSAGRLEEAESLALELVDKNIQPPIGLIILGRIKCIQKSTAEGLNYFRKALSLNPDNTQALQLLVSNCIANGQSQNAIEFCGELTKKLKDKSHIHFYLGRLYQHIGNLNTAVSCYEKALNLVSEELNPYIPLAKILRRQGNVKSAINYLKQGLKKHPENKEIGFLYHKFIADE